MLFVWILLSILVFIDYITNTSNNRICYGYLVAILFSCGPPLLLYLNYLYHSFGKTVIIDHHKQIIYVSNKGYSVSYNIGDIHRILKKCSYPLAENRTQWIPTDPFFHFKIIMKNGESIIITSLMTDKYFSIYGYKIEIEKQLVSIIL